MGETTKAGDAAKGAGSGMGFLMEAISWLLKPLGWLVEGLTAVVDGLTWLIEGLAKGVRSVLEFLGVVEKVEKKAPLKKMGEDGAENAQKVADAYKTATQEIGKLQLEAPRLDKASFDKRKAELSEY